MTSCIQHQKKPVNTMESLTHLLDDGLNPVKSNLSGHPEEIIDTGSTIQQLPYLIQQIQDTIIYTLESQHINNEKIYNDKLNISLKNFQWPEWNKKLGQDLGLIAKEYKDYLNSSVWDKYPLLLSHIKTVLAGLDLIYSNGYAKETIPLSWLTIKKSSLKALEMNSQRIYSPLHIPLAVECMETENSALKPPKQRKSKKNALNPTTHYLSAQVTRLELNKAQEKYFSDLAHGYDLVYNKAISIIQHRLKYDLELDYTTFRDDVLRFDDYFKFSQGDKEFLSKMPYRIKEKAAENVASILKAIITNWKKFRYNKKKKKKNRKKKTIKYQCIHVYKKGVHKNQRCDNKTNIENSYCSAHKPKKLCFNHACKRLVYPGLVKCKIHSSEQELAALKCTYISSKGKTCTNNYTCCETKRCNKHIVNSYCKFEHDNGSVCNKPSVGDYCLNHAITMRIKFKYRNRNGNKYICLNERDWDRLISLIGPLIDINKVQVTKPEHEFVIIYNKVNKEWKLISPIYKPKRLGLKNKTLCSLDPGEKIPYTLYSFDDGEVYEISTREETMKHLTKYKRRCEDLKHQKHELKNIYKDPPDIKTYREKSKRIRQLNRAYTKNKNKAFNRIKDAHWNLANWICSRYEYVVLPKFRISNIVPKNKGLPKWIKKNILAWNHAKFRDIMCYTASKYNTKIILGDEFFTTKTCVVCRRLNSVDKSARRYKCNYEDCKFEGPRDVTGAINNGLLYFT